MSKLGGCFCLPAEKDDLAQNVSGAGRSWPAVEQVEMPELSWLGVEEGIRGVGRRRFEIDLLLEASVPGRAHSLLSGSRNTQGGQHL